MGLVRQFLQVLKIDALPIVTLVMNFEFAAHRSHCFFPSNAMGETLPTGSNVVHEHIAVCVYGPSGMNTGRVTPVAEMLLAHFGLYLWAQGWNLLAGSATLNSRGALY